MPLPRFFQSNLFGHLPAIAICIFFFILIGAGLQMLEEAENKRFNTERRQHVGDQLTILRVSLEAEISAEIGLAKALTSLYESQPDLTQAQFESMAKILFQRSNITRSFGLAEGTTIKYVYPFEGNSKAIGKKYEDLESQWPLVQRSIQSGKIIIAGPLELVQGGRGLILRCPVFFNDPDDGQRSYLGLVSVIWDKQKLMEQANLQRYEDLEVSLIGADGEGYLGNAIIGSKDILKKDPVTYQVDLPDGTWILTAVPTSGWNLKSPQIAVYRLLALATALIIMFLTALQILSQQRRYRISMDLLDSRDQLQASEQRYRLLAENISDVIWIMELEHYRFTYISSSVERQRGIPARQAMRNSLEQTITSDSLQFFRSVLPTRLASFKSGHEETYYDELEQRCSDGSTIWTETVTQFHNNEITNKIELYGVTRDISERKRDLKEKESLIHELQNTKKKLEALSMTDALTSLHNRRYLDEVLNDEWRRAQREPRPISMIIIDIDHFKRYNDTLGHPEGDKCLTKVATIFDEMLNRPGDIAVRYGGEELIGVLPETDINGAQHVAQRLLDKMTEEQIPHPDSPVADHVTVSIGIAMMVPNLLLKPEDLLAKADSALYMAKKQGRNTMVVAAGDE